MLGRADLPAVAALLDTDPIAGCPIAARIEAAADHPGRLGGDLWGYGDPLSAVCLSAANLVPIAAGPAAVGAFAQRAVAQGRRCSSIVGRTAYVEPLWRALEPDWGPARVIRARQPLLAINVEPLVDSDPAIRRVREDELDLLMPACVRMFTEEIGVSPVGFDGGALYRARILDLVSAGRAFARIENGTVVFKAEIGVVARAGCQLQGVWVDPDHRGRGYGARGIAAVVRAARAEVAPVVSLYVNDFNTAARAVYTRVGFDEVGMFTSVMF